MAASLVTLGCAESKVRVHHLGVDLDRIPFEPRTWDPSTPLRVLIAASFREKKGIPYALEAVSQLRKDLDVEITLIGDATNGSRSQAEKSRILQVIDEHRLGGCLRRLGYQPYEVLLKEAYDHHVFLSPSVTAADGDCEGGAPVAIIDMAATGMMIVSTTHCDIPAIVQDGETGFLAQERDVQGLVQCLRQLADQPDRWLGMQQRARQQTEAEFNAKLQGERLAAIYEELAAS